MKILRSLRCCGQTTTGCWRAWCATCKRYVSKHDATAADAVASAAGHRCPARIDEAPTTERVP